MGALTIGQWELVALPPLQLRGEGEGEALPPAVGPSTCASSAARYTVRAVELLLPQIVSVTSVLALKLAVAEMEGLWGMLRQPLAKGKRQCISFVSVPVRCCESDAEAQA